MLRVQTQYFNQRSWSSGYDRRLPSHHLVVRGKSGLLFKYLKIDGSLSALVEMDRRDFFFIDGSWLEAGG